MAAGGGVGRRIRMPRRRRAWVSCRWASTISSGGPSPTFPSRRRRRRRHRHSPKHSRSDGQRNPHVPSISSCRPGPVVFVQFVFMRERLFDMNSHIEQTKTDPYYRCWVGGGTMVLLPCEVDDLTGTIPPLSSLTWKEAYYGWQLFRLNRRAGFGIISMRTYDPERSYLSGVRIM